MKNEWDEDVEHSLSVLQKSGIILYPTDTVWGIGCDATDTDAVEKIISLKQRPNTKSFVTLVAEEKDILKYVAAPDFALFDYLNTTIKPTTVIYPGAIGLAENVLAEDGSVAIRICKEPFCKHLIKRLCKPIISTSANISGTLSPQVFSDIDRKIIDGVDYIVQYRRNDYRKALPSSIISWENGNIVTIRE